MPDDRKDYTVTLEVGLEMYEQAGVEALEKMSNAGIDIRLDKPVLKDRYFDGRLPANTNDLSMSDLGELMAAMAEWSDYVNGLLTVAKAELMNSEQQRDLVEAKVRKTKSGSEREKKDDTITDVRYVESNAKWLAAREYHDMLENNASAASRDAKLLSRLIEVRKLSFEQNRRTDSVGGGPRRDPFTRG